MEQHPLSLVLALSDGPLQSPRQDAQAVLGQDRRQAIEQIIDRSVTVIVDRVDVGLGNSVLGQFGRHGVDRSVDGGCGHQANSLMLIAPDLLRLASMPWPKAR